jgi:phage FluMu gp28-like protein
VREAEFPLELLGQELPGDHDPLADGILMAHQKAWLEDTSDLKLAVKGRRTGITYAEALDDTLIAASARSAGGDNIFYIGDTKDKGLEFIRYVAHFARIVAKEMTAYEEFLFEDQQESGESKHISAYRVRFASGYQVVALSSRPANIRGLQGIVVIDEAAFHKDVGLVLEAVNALLIWGGKIRVISTHNGEDNAFNQLITDTRAGLYAYKIHHIPFSAAVRNGLYERVCLLRGWEPSEAGKAEWLDKIIRSYGPRAEARDEELEAIPRKSSGAYLPRSLVQKAQGEAIPVLRWSKGEAWYLDDNRLAEAKAWFADHVKPLLDRLDPRRRSALGQDFARDGDLSVILVAQEDAGDAWKSAFQLEMRRIPFDVQQYVLFQILERLPRLTAAALDARGNGQSHAEAAAQRFGVERVLCIKATVQWYAMAFPEYRAALEDRSFILPPGEDVIADHRLAVLVRGNPSVSDQHTKGADGEQRHGDGMIAALLCHHASQTEPEVYGYEPARRERPGLFDAPDAQWGFA